MNETSPYAWRIDKDNLFNPAWDGVVNEAGTVGPHDAPSTNRQVLAIHYPHHHQFRMYDDDGILYYTGTLYWSGDAEPDETYLYAPLADYGAPNAGAVVIKYTDRPQWECG